MLRARTDPPILFNVDHLARGSRFTLTSTGMLIARVRLQGLATRRFTSTAAQQSTPALGQPPVVGWVVAIVERLDALMPLPPRQLVAVC